MNAQQAKAKLLAIEIPRDDLALCIAIPIFGVRPPNGADAKAALDQLDQISPGMAESFRAAADVAVIYFHQCINAARQPS